MHRPSPPGRDPSLDGAPAPGAPSRAAVAGLQAALGDRYVVERAIGRGGMATVYVAEDRRHGRRVAVKVLHPDLTATLGADRFVREIHIAAALTHPNILPLHDSGSAGGLLYYVMPYVAGETLRARLRREPRLPVDEALRVAAEVAGALDYAHREGVVHRDVKPENVLLVDGHAVVADFGIAHALREAGGDRLTASGLTLGTPAYMSPEQASGEREIDGRSDVFSLGCVLYEMLAGEAPFAAPTAGASFYRVLTESPAPVRALRPDVPERAAAVIERALAKDPDARFATAGAMAHALREVAATTWSGAGGAAPRDGASRARRRVALGAAAVALAAAAGGAFAWRARPRAAAGGLPSVAVLPFANESADTADAYLGVGIAEELLGALADVPGLRVASQTSSVAQGGRGRDPRALGRALGVASVLEGSVRRRGGTVRVAARLVDARADSLLWHDSFDRPAAAMFDVQEEIARAIVERLRVRLGAATPAIVRRRTPNPVAHDLVLRVAALRNDSGSLVSAVGMLNRAIALDSTYAEAWAHLARVYQALAVFDDQTRLADEPGMTAGELLRRARRAAQRAVVLDPRSATAHSALGALLFRYDWDWAGAERELSRAIQLNPTAPEPHQTYHRFLRSMGRFEEARRELALAMRYAASRRSRGQNVGRISFFEHDFERAIRETLTDPDTTSRVMFTWLGQAYIGARRFAEAESALVRGSRGDAPANLLMRGLVYARTGRPALAREILHRVPGTENDLPTHVAAVLLALGDTAAAASEIKRAVDTKDPLVVDLKVDPWIAPLRDDPRFRPIYDRLRFP